MINNIINLLTKEYETTDKDFLYLFENKKENSKQCIFFKHFGFKIDEEHLSFNLTKNNELSFNSTKEIWQREDIKNTKKLMFYSEIENYKPNQILLLFVDFNQQTITNEYIKIKILNTIKINLLNFDDLFIKNKKENTNHYEFIYKKNIKQTIIDILLKRIHIRKMFNELEKNNQLIIYGTAGLGKSHSIKGIIDLKKEEDIKEYSIHRTVFHPEFSYYDFVGKLLPITNIDNNKNKSISYEFEQGIFTKAYNEAINYPDKNIYLVIDEINRGYTTGIFGDIFLLLDRNENKESAYEIEWSGLQGQSIKDKDGKIIENHKIKLPKNFYIIGTMNTSDKTTIKLDKAFERRFNKYFISLVESIENLNDEIILESNKNIKWKNFLTKLNNKIKNDLSNNFEDIDNEFIGSYFIKSNNNLINITDIKYSLMYHLWYSTYSENRKSLTNEITFEDFINKGYYDFINKIIES